MGTRRCLIPFTVALWSATTASAGISGRVLSSEGKPLAGASVVAYALETADERAARLLAGKARAPVARARVEAGGSFRLDRTPAVVEVEVHASGFAPDFGTVADAETVAFALRPAPAVSGRVVSAGRPVVGATVAWMGDADSLGSHVIVVRTRGDGTYEVPDPGVWATGLLITHPDFAPLEESLGPLEFRSRVPLRHELDPGVAVAGRIVEEASGRAVAGATIVVDGWPLARSSRDGSFVVRHTRPTWASLVARGRGLVGEAKPAGGSLIVSAKPARRLTGVVRDAETKGRLAGAVVTLYDEEWTARSSALTDRRGRYAFGALAPGRYQAFATRAGYSASRLGRSDPEAIDLRQSASQARDFRLTPRPRIVGRVQDEHGRPISGALVRPGAKGQPNVYTATDTRGREWPTAWTAPDGSFDMTLEDGWTRRESGMALTAFKRGYAAGRLEPAALEGVPLTVTLRRGVELTGRVTTSDGEPIPGASVVLVEGGRLGGVHGAFPEDPGDEGWTKTDPKGRFVTRVHPVEHHLIIRKGGFTPTTVRGHDPASGQKLDVVLEPAAEIRGRILRSDGTGIPEVQLFAMGARAMVPTFATTASDGRFVIGGLSPGTYELHFMKEATGLGGSRSVTAPDPDLRIEPGPAGTIRGIVTDAGTHAPVERFSVELEPPASPERFGFGGRHAPSIQAVGGAFAFEEVPVGEIALTVRAEGFVSQRLQRVEVTTGVDVLPLEIALDRGSRIRGLVTTEAGAPLSDVHVSAEGQDGEVVSVEADEFGAFDLQGVSPGEVKLEFRRQGYITARRTVEASGTIRASRVSPPAATPSGPARSTGARPRSRTWTWRPQAGSACRCSGRRRQCFRVGSPASRRRTTSRRSWCGRGGKEARATTLPWTGPAGSGWRRRRRGRWPSGRRRLPRPAPSGRPAHRS
jgi:uncharacterized GH25 family protein